MFWGNGVQKPANEKAVTSCADSGAEEIAPGSLITQSQSQARCPDREDIYHRPLHHRLWAKTDKTGRSHPLVCHLIDVAQVALALWESALTDSVRTQFGDLLGLDVPATGRLLAFWAGLHDIGKASPAFQRRWKAAEASLGAAGLSFPKLFVQEPCSHGTITVRVLGEFLELESGLERQLARGIARAVGGHHGAWPPPRDVQSLRSKQVGGNDWLAVRHKLLHEMTALFDPQGAKAVAAQDEASALVTLLSGLVAVSDWIGSMEKYFPFVEAPVDPADYAERAAGQARQALVELGWVGWTPPTEAVSFQELVSFEPRPMQERVVALAEQLGQPAMVIIEAPTGTGKTEAALYLADRWATVCHQRGLYVAMPTMATSNQMFTRVGDVLARRYPESLVNLHLIHSQARWRDDVQALRLETADERKEGTVAAMAWFLPRKRSLLAPFGVGTVDQALLSVLQTRHFFVRLFGLSHKTVIFDEVHAYDTYMSAIFQRLLGWLRAIGASVVLLSATLPERTRRELLEAYAGRADVLWPKMRYPALTWAMGSQTGVVPVQAAEHRTLKLEWIGREPEGIADGLTAELRQGGCAAVICNTVSRAQEVYRALQAAQVVSPDNLTLFHARFPFAWRDQIEEKVLSAFGKHGERPRKAVVVATQVLEQSLDLDFDLMITDLAPIDLLIQRAGRLHRHERDPRPAPCAMPRLLITIPRAAGGIPDFERDVYVYERYVLLRSYLALQGRERISLPAETTGLIEAVYGDEGPPADGLTPALSTALHEARDRMLRHQQEHEYKARQKLVPGCETDDVLAQRSLALEEDNPELHEAFQALTRLAPLGVSLVCLHQSAVGLKLEPDSKAPAIDLSQPPEPDMTRELARHTVTATHWPVVQHFLAQPPPVAWRDHPLLHIHRLAIFVDGLCPLEGTPYTLELSRELGLVIQREEVQ